MIQKFLDKVRPNFEDGGKLKAFRSVFEGVETFLMVPNATSKTGVSIHDAIDSKRIMSFVVIALLPALLFGMYNIGYWHYHQAELEASMLTMFLYGLVVMLPKSWFLMPSASALSSWLPSGSTRKSRKVIL